MTDPTRRRLLKIVLGTVALMTRPVRAAESPPSDSLLTLAYALIQNLHAAQLRPFLREWPPPSDRRHVDPSSVPVVHWLPSMAPSAPPFAAPLVTALEEAAPSLAWRRSYSVATAGVDFYQNYGWTEFAGLTGPVPSQHLACGVLLLGPQVSYPPHRHEAEEIYVPLVGTARWQHGNGGWREEPPGTVIHHARYQPHAMRTGAEPLLALYLWRSDNLAQSSHLDHPLRST
jgi:hypothetical protein